MIGTGTKFTPNITIEEKAPQRPSSFRNSQDLHDELVIPAFSYPNKTVEGNIYDPYPQTQSNTDSQVESFANLVTQSLEQEKAPKMPIVSFQGPKTMHVSQFQHLLKSTAPISMKESCNINIATASGGFSPAEALPTE